MFRRLLAGLLEEFVARGPFRLESKATNDHNHPGNRCTVAK
jgi:hypothetical protein